MFSFLSAVFLWGLPLAGIPVVVHLLHRRQRRVVRWGAMQFLREAASRRRRMWRWDDLWLMLLRTLAIVVLVLALARPVLRSGWFGSGGTRELVLLLDDSMSTARSVPAGGVGTVHEAILDRAGRLIDALHTGDRVRVLLASAAPRVLTPEPVTIDGEAAAAIKSQLDQLEPTLAAGNLLRCVTEALSGETDPDVTERVVAVVTDGQAYGWRLDAGRAWVQLKEKAASAIPPTALTVIDVTRSDVGESDKASTPVNLSVDSVTSSRRVTSPGQPITLKAVVCNTGATASAPATLHWLQGDRSLAVTTLGALASGQATTATVSHAFQATGVHAVTCRVEPGDALPPDNTGCVVVEVVDSVPVLVLDGSAGSDPLDTQIDYLLAAMGGGPDVPDNQRAGVFRPQVALLSTSAACQPGQARAVVCMHPSRLDSTGLERLISFVRRGGGLWLVLGPNSDPAWFNANLHAGRGALSLVSVGQPTGDAHNHEVFERVRPPSDTHPATWLLADTHRLDIDRGRIYRRFPLEIAAGRQDLSVLLATDQGAPLVVENGFGRGRVLVQAVPMNVSWSSLPLCQAFVVMVQEWLWYLAEPAYARWNLQPGEGLIASFDADRFGSGEPPVADVTSPVGQTVQAAGRVEQGLLVYRFAQTLQPGSYALTIPAAGAGRESFPFHVRRDAGESDLTPLSDTDRQRLASAGGWHFAADPLARDLRIASAPRSEPVWTALLFSLLGLWAAELLLAGHVTRRRSSRAAPIRLEAAPPRFTKRRVLRSEQPRSEASVPVEGY